MQRNLQACSQGLALRPFSACVIGNPRDLVMKLDLRRFSSDLAITPSDSGKRFKRRLSELTSLGLRCVLRFSQPLDAFLLPMNPERVSSRSHSWGSRPSEVSPLWLPTLTSRASSSTSSFEAPVLYDDVFGDLLSRLSTIGHLPSSLSRVLNVTTVFAFLSRGRLALLALTLLRRFLLSRDRLPALLAFRGVGFQRVRSAARHYSWHT